jgi:hypothetical protein
VNVVISCAKSKEVTGVTNVIGAVAGRAGTAAQTPGRFVGAVTTFDRFSGPENGHHANKANKSGWCDWW